MRRTSVYGAAMIRAFFKRIKRMRTVSKLAYIEQRRNVLREDIHYARQELFRLDGKAALIRHELRSM